MKPVFVVSTGRCGSKMIARTFAKHPGFLALHEPLPYLRPENFRAWREDNPQELIKKVEQKRNWIIAEAANNDLVYVESSHFLAHLIAHLASIYDCKFVHLYRDGRDFVRSGLLRRWYTGEHVEWELPDTDIEGMTLQPPKEATTRLMKMAWLWNEINSNIVKQLDRISSERKFTVRLEKFDRWRLEQLVNFCGVSVSSYLLDKMLAVVNSLPNKSTKEFTMLPKEEWASEENAQFFEFAAPMMQNLGYIK